MSKAFLMINYKHLMMKTVVVLHTFSEIFIAWSRGHLSCTISNLCVSARRTHSIFLLVVVVALAVVHSAAPFSAAALALLVLAAACSPPSVAVLVGGTSAAPLS